MLAMIMLNVDNGADDIDHADIVLTDGGGDVTRQHYLVSSRDDHGDIGGDDDDHDAHDEDGGDDDPCQVLPGRL